MKNIRRCRYCEGSKNYTRKVDQKKKTGHDFTEDDSWRDVKKNKTSDREKTRPTELTKRLTVKWKTKQFGTESNCISISFCTSLFSEIDIYIYI